MQSFVTIYRSLSMNMVGISTETSLQNMVLIVRKKLKEKRYGFKI